MSFSVARISGRLFCQLSNAEAKSIQDLASAKVWGAAYAALHNCSVMILDSDGPLGVAAPVCSIDDHGVEKKVGQ